MMWECESCKYRKRPGVRCQLADDRISPYPKDAPCLPWMERVFEVTLAGLEVCLREKEERENAIIQ